MLHNYCMIFWLFLYRKILFITINNRYVSLYDKIKKRRNKALILRLAQTVFRICQVPLFHFVTI